MYKISCIHKNIYWYVKKFVKCYNIINVIFINYSVFDGCNIYKYYKGETI